MRRTGQSNPVSTAPGRSMLVQASAASDVTDLYVSVYPSPPNARGRLMYGDADIADLIRQAHARHIRIWAAYGNSDWPAIGCAATGFSVQRMAEVVAYNAAHEDAGFDGVALDIEPSAPQSPTDFQHLLALYQCIRESLPRRGPDRLVVAAAIRFFWNNTVQFPAGGLSTSSIWNSITLSLWDIETSRVRRAPAPHRMASFAWTNLFIEYPNRSRSPGCGPCGCYVLFRAARSERTG